MQLSNCPFCGSLAKRHWNCDARKQWVVLGCSDQECIAHELVYKDGWLKDEAPTGPGEAAIEREAAAIWNRRESNSVG